MVFTHYNIIIDADLSIIEGQRVFHQLVWSAAEPSLVQKFAQKVTFIYPLSDT
jgi:alpha-D-ribose 1-methylphosphonate 5-triphosphate synthase subunit PhnH